MCPCAEKTWRAVLLNVGCQNNSKCVKVYFSRLRHSILASLSVKVSVFCCAMELVSIPMCPTGLFVKIQVLNSHQHLGMRTVWHTAVPVSNFLFGIDKLLVPQYVNRPSFGDHFVQSSYYIDTCKHTII